MSEKSNLINIATVDGTAVDLSNIDLSPWGIQGGFIVKEEAEVFIKSNSIEDHSDRNWKIVMDNAQGVEGGGGRDAYWEYVNLLWPLNIDNPPSELDYFEAIEAIRIIYPSEIYIQNIFRAQYFKESGIYISSWSTYNSYNYSKYKKPEDHFFIYQEGSLAETNQFLAFFKDNSDRHDYIRNAMRYYSDSFRVNSPEMTFLCLCICLETIVPGREQLSFRFRRNLAVLCAESPEGGRKILEKAKKLYNFRSKLVHSGSSEKDFEKFDLFLEYAQLLASKMIVEMLLHDISKIEDLDRKITELGFGEGNKISAGYKPFEGNKINWFKVSEYEF